MHDRRQTTRQRVEWPLTLVFSDTGHNLRVRGYDLSSGGLGLLSPDRVEPGTACRMKFRIKPQPDDLGVELEPWGEVVQVSEGEAGVYRVGVAFSMLNREQAGNLAHYLQSLGHASRQATTA
ncbi:MAG: PilZ domain-containing protein [Ectothiorhodospiraceae bacterium]|nr:PilZ domain-containing protein [Ectothiorhodospiraceae bacterium]